MEPVSLAAVPMNLTRRLAPSVMSILCSDSMLSLQDKIKGDPGSI